MADDEVVEATPSADLAPDALPMSVARDRGSRAVAALLAAAAVIAAIIAARAAFLASDASGMWQTALRTEVKRSAGASEVARYLYQTELPTAVAIAEARIRQHELETAAAGATGTAQQALFIEASVAASRIEAFEPTSDLASDVAYALRSGGFDLGKRLADLRAAVPDLVALDPDGLESAGDALATQSQKLTVTGIAIAVCVLFGALAQPFRRWRRTFLVGGTVALVIGTSLALVVEVTS